MLARIRISNWPTPYRQSALGVLVSLTGVIAVAATLWFGSLLGIVLAMLIAVPLAAGWTAVLVIGMRSAWHCRSDGRAAIGAAAAPLLGMLLAGVLTLPMLWGVGWALSWISFLGNYYTYEAIVERAGTGAFDARAGVWQHQQGVDLVVDTGPPRRLAFPNPGGLLDNWSGVVYDPTGDVMQADGFDATTGKFAAPDSIKKLFEGDLVSCRHLTGAYYHCTFT